MIRKKQTNLYLLIFYLTILLKMNRPPPRPRMMNNMYRDPGLYNRQWRSNHDQPSRFPWSENSRFATHTMRTEQSPEHWCETCDRGFPSAELLNKHKQQHQKCNIDGCQFIAHPNVITKHIQMQHSTGLYKKIANLNKPEDIQKWREERKKKYPTKSNIEKKLAECKEKKERGEKMALRPEFRNNKRKSTDDGPEVKRKHSFDKRNQNQRTNRHDFNSSSSISNNINAIKPLVKKIPYIIPSALKKNLLKPFNGIFKIDMDDKVENIAEPSDCTNGLFEDDDYEASQVVHEETQKSQEPIVCGALTSLMCDYATSDEETGSVLPENTLVTSSQTLIKPFSVDNITNENLVNKPDITLHDANESDHDGPEEIKIVKTNAEYDTSQDPVIKHKAKPSAPVKKTIPPRNQQKQNHNSKRRVPSTLLQKLLHKEIRQERNIVLQCIRYIKKNNYFDK